jgi:hypothetical protein
MQSQNALPLAMQPHELIQHCISIQKTTDPKTIMHFSILNASHEFIQHCLSIEEFTDKQICIYKMFNAPTWTYTKLHFYPKKTTDKQLCIFQILNAPIWTYTTLHYNQYYTGPKLHFSLRVGQKYTRQEHHLTTFSVSTFPHVLSRTAAVPPEVYLHYPVSSLGSF